MGLFDKLFGRGSVRDTSQPAVLVATSAADPEVGPAEEEISEQSSGAVAMESVATAEPEPELEPPYPPIIMNERAIPWQAADAVREKVDDLDILLEIAFSSPIEKARIAAVEKIDDQQALFAIALDPHEGIKQKELTYDAVQKAAAKKLEDPALLKRLMLETGIPGTVDMRYDELESADMADVARNAKHELCRRSAIVRLDDVEVLEGVAIADDDWNNRRTAIERIGDASALKRIFDEAHDEYERKCAILQAGGYVCKGCGKAFWPDGEGPMPCTCPECGEENHDWQFQSNVTTYRDYESGTRWDECSRCGAKTNVREVFTM